MADRRGDRRGPRAVHLRDKVTVGGPNAVTEAVLAEAEKAVAGMEDHYLATYNLALGILDRALATLAEASTEWQDPLDRMVRGARDLTGLGTTFGYDLSTIVGKELAVFLEEFESPPDTAALEVIGLHLEALRAIYAQGLKGDGGTAGKELLDGLQKVADKMGTQRPKTER